MKNVNFRRAALKTEGRAGGLYKKAGRRVAEKSGEGCTNDPLGGCAPRLGTTALDLQERLEQPFNYLIIQKHQDSAVNG